MTTLKELKEELAQIQDENAKNRKKLKLQPWSLLPTTRLGLLREILDTTYVNGPLN